MNLSDNRVAADEVERLLRNWGRWCRVPKVRDGEKWYFRDLWYSEQPIHRDYRAPANRDTKAPPSISVNDAELANEAFIRMRGGEEKTAIAEFYAIGHSVAVIADIIGISKRSAERRLQAGRQQFFDELRKK